MAVLPSVSGRPRRPRGEAVTAGGGMTREEALAEARRRWQGECDTFRSPFARKYAKSFTVGVVVRWGRRVISWDVKGEGRSYEAAFADADRRAAK